MSEPIPAVTYHRASTNEQEQSIERQRAQVEAYAAAHGYRVVGAYEDETADTPTVVESPEHLRPRRDVDEE
jgi:DNA invertase Pin-like site-specific DNA recombinase